MVRRTVFLVLLLAMVPLRFAGAQVTAVSQNANLNTSLGTLSGTWLVPQQSGRMPIVLIVPDGGPIDREGNSALLLPGRNDAYKMLAEALAARGVASLRYDKRGVSRSVRPGQKESDLRFEDAVNDAANIVDIARGESRFSSVTIVGHGEGSLVGMLAAKIAEADGFVSIAGAARAGAAVLRDRLRPLTSSGAAWEACEQVLKSLEGGQTVGLPKALQANRPAASLIRPSVQPYLVSWMRFTPAGEIARITVPVLILHGASDRELPVDEAHALKAARLESTLVIVPGMNHMMKAVGDDPARDRASYSDPSLALAAAVPDAIAAHLKVVPTRRPTVQ